MWSRCSINFRWRFTTPGDPDMGRGSSSIKDAGRLIFTLTPMAEDEATQFSISQADRRQFIRLDSAKVNLTAPARNATWFRLVSVAIGNATKEYPAGDHVQTVETWTPPDTWAGLSSIILNAAQSGLNSLSANALRHSLSLVAHLWRKWRTHPQPGYLNGAAYRFLRGVSQRIRVGCEH
jgi:hypothetical protein